MGFRENTGPSAFLQSLPREDVTGHVRFLLGQNNTPVNVRAGWLRDNTEKVPFPRTAATEMYTRAVSNLLSAGQEHAEVSGHQALERRAWREGSSGWRTDHSAGILSGDGTSVPQQPSPEPMASGAPGSCARAAVHTRAERVWNPQVR